MTMFNSIESIDWCSLSKASTGKTIKVGDTIQCEAHTSQGEHLIVGIVLESVQY